MSNDKGEIWVKMPKNEEIEWEKGEFDVGNVRSRLSKRVSRLGSVEISRRRREIHRRSGISSSRNVKGRLNGRPYFFAAKSQRGLSGQVSQDGLRGRQIVRPSTRMFK